MNIDGRVHMLVETALILIDGLLFPIASNRDLHARALNARNKLSEWSDDQTVPTAHEWAEVMEDVIAIRDSLEASAKEAQAIIDTPKRG